MPTDPDDVDLADGFLHGMGNALEAVRQIRGVDQPGARRGGVLADRWSDVDPGELSRLRFRGHPVSGGTSTTGPARRPGEDLTHDG